MNNSEWLIKNANVITADPENPRAEALLVRGNRIAYVGPAQVAETLKNSASPVVDAAGGTLLPGFIDCHYHMLWGAMDMDDIQLGAVESLDELAGAVRTYAQERPDRLWLSGTGLRYGVVPAGETLTRLHLDAIEPVRPLAITSYCGHTVWANTRALELAGLLHGGEMPPGSVVVMGADNLAAGELRESAAIHRVLDLIPKPSADEQKKLLRKAVALASSYGVTSLHNMDGSLADMAIYRTLEQEDALNVRLYVAFAAKPGDAAQALDEALAMRREYTNAHLRGGAVKFFMDGVIETGTALLVDEYADAPNFYGSAHFSTAQFVSQAAEYDWLGFQIFVHATGDGSVRRTLDGFDEIQRLNGRRDSRHRIEHIELSHPDDWPRFARLGVIASMQPLHAPLTAPAAFDPWPERVGRQRWGRSFAWQSLRDAGARLVFGSDWSVASPNVLLGIQAALTRRPWIAGLPDQRQRLDDAVASYTRDAAYAEFGETQKGMLRAGYLADLALLAADIEQVDPAEIGKIPLAMTVLDGKIVYKP